VSHIASMWLVALSSVATSYQCFDVAEPSSVESVIGSRFVAKTL